MFENFVWPMSPSTATESGYAGAAAGAAANAYAGAPSSSTW